MSEYEFCKEQINCDECRFSDFGKDLNCCFDRTSYEQGRADERTKKTYAEKMVERCSQMIVEALQNLSIEDINMYQLGYEKGKADEIDEIEAKLYEYGFIWTEHAKKVWEDIREQLKEQNNA